MNPVAMTPNAPRVNCSHAAHTPLSDNLLAGLPDVLDAVADAVITTQTNPSVRRIAALRTCLAAAERQLGRIAAALEVTG